MNAALVETVVTATKAVSAFLVRAQADIPEIREVSGSRLSGLCATGAHILVELLVEAGLRARLVVGRTIYGNACHILVEVEGLYADPTRWQFDEGAKWAVATNPPNVWYHGRYPVVWSVDGLPARWQARHHPRTHYPLLGLGEFRGVAQG